MHIVQLLLVEADTHQEAVEKVSDALNSKDSSEFWSDWWDTEGGRWKGFFGDNMPNVICYKDDPEFFDEQVKNFLQSRNENISQLLKHYAVGEVNVETLIETHDHYMQDFDKQLKMWAIKSAVRIMLGEWISDTGIYDLESDTAFLGDFVVRAKETPEKQFGVLVDFHF